MNKQMRSPERYFTTENRDTAMELYGNASNLPLVCPHGHVDPQILADPEHSFGTPTELLILPDHYLLRMLYSQGIALEEMGWESLEGGYAEKDMRKIWKRFAGAFPLFLGTPSGLWLREELSTVFGVEEELNAESAWRVYDRVAECLEEEAFRPRALFERFHIEVLCTTDAASDDLRHHRAIRASGWDGKVLPTFRPDGVFNPAMKGWKRSLAELGEACGWEIGTYAAFIRALEQRRAFFREMGAVASDHAVTSPMTLTLAAGEMESIFQHGLKEEASPEEGERFTAHMLVESARMSVEDGLVMQLHAGAMRNHNQLIFERFGADKGADIPVRVEFTRNLQPLLNRHGNDPRLRLILFTLDESTYARELAPLAGHYPALRLGPPWWFHDSLNGIRRYLDQVVETAGIQNLAGFNDDTRAFCSIPARHDLWRRACADWLAGLVDRGILSMEAAREAMNELAVGLARKAYRLGG